MRLISLLLILAGCTNLPQREPAPVPVPETIYQEQPPPKKEKPTTTIITINPPAKPQAICVPLAADEKQKILQVLDCLIEADRPKK